MTKRIKQTVLFIQGHAKIPALAGMFLCMLCLLHPAQAAQKTAGMFSGEYLMNLCASDAKGKEIIEGGHTACQAYIAGIVDYHNLMRSLGTQPIVDICVPNTASMKRLQNIVWVYLAKNKDHGVFIASPAVALALYDYYPCTAKMNALKRRR